MFLRLLTATVLPSKSLADLSGLSPGAMMAPKSRPGSPVEDAPAAIATMSRPRVCAISSELILLKPNSRWPVITGVTSSAPPCAVCSVTSRFCLAKKPLATPR